MPATRTAIPVPHCQQCGSTDREDLEEGDQGYSACCNEIVVWGGDCREGLCSHGAWGEPATYPVKRTRDGDVARWRSHLALNLFGKGQHGSVYSPDGLPPVGRKHFRTLGADVPVEVRQTRKSGEWTLTVEGCDVATFRTKTDAQRYAEGRYLR
jgi:hypothetical protein